MGAQLTYDNEGRLTGWQSAPSNPTSTTTNLYDGEGNRVEQVATVSGVTTSTVYVGSQLEIATSGSATTKTAYYGGLALTINGLLYYLVSDGLGSVAGKINSSGVVRASQLYDPYGSVRYSNGTMVGTKGYTGQRAEALTGLDDYNARYYDPVAGQFTSADRYRAPSSPSSSA